MEYSIREYQYNGDVAELAKNQIFVSIRSNAYLIDEKRCYRVKTNKCGRAYVTYRGHRRYLVAAIVTDVCGVKMYRFIME